MRKSYLIAVLLMLFFIGTLVMTNNALAICYDYQRYECNITATCDVGVVYTGVECVSLCNDPGNTYLNGSMWGCNLGLLGNKNMVGSGSSVLGDIGCYVELHGRSMTAMYYEEFDGCVIKLDCTPCVVCCP